MREMRNGNGLSVIATFGSVTMSLGWDILPSYLREVDLEFYDAFDGTRAFDTHKLREGGTVFTVIKMGTQVD